MFVKNCSKEIIWGNLGFSLKGLNIIFPFPLKGHAMYILLVNNLKNYIYGGFEYIYFHLFPFFHIVFCLSLVLWEECVATNSNILYCCCVTLYYSNSM